MNVAEQLVHARTSADLGESPDGRGAVDWLRACGSVAHKHRTAMLVWQLTEQRDGSALSDAVKGMLVWCIQLGIKHNPIETVSHVLTWLADPVCKTCHGRRFTLIPGTSTLSDHACPDCNGVGQRPQHDWGADELLLYARLQRDQAEAVAAFRQKLPEG